MICLYGERYLHAVRAANGVAALTGEIIIGEQRMWACEGGRVKSYWKRCLAAINSYPDGACPGTVSKGVQTQARSGRSEKPEDRAPYIGESCISENIKAKLIGSIEHVTWVTGSGRTAGTSTDIRAETNALERDSCTCGCEIGRKLECCAECKVDVAKIETWHCEGTRLRVCLIGL